MKRNYKLFNQMAGPLFRELSCTLAEKTTDNVTLFTGHPDTLRYQPKLSELQIKKMPPYNRRSKFTRLYSWVTYTFKSIFELIKMNKNDVAIVASNPPVIILFLIVARLFRRQYFVIVYDIYPDVLVSLGYLKTNSTLVQIWENLNRIALNGALGVFTISEKMAAKIEEKFDPVGTFLGKVEVIPVWVNTELIKPVQKFENPIAIELGLQDKFIVLYSGNLGISHDIESILLAAKQLSKQKNIMFVIVGEGAKKEDAVRFKEKNNLENLMILPFQPEDTLPFSLGMADISIVTLEMGAEDIMIPSKTFYYMASGAAVIGICNKGSDLAQTIQKASCGMTVQPGQFMKLAETVTNLSKDLDSLQKFKHSARAYSVKFHEKNICTSFIIEKFFKVVNAKNT